MVMDDLFSGSSAVLLYFFAALGGGLKPRLDEKARPIDRVLELLREWRQRTRERRELATLDDYLLHDIGLSRSQAQFESGKAFWRA
jgi:uncharacterized protein YjiS (DUF1127 family)